MKQKDLANSLTSWECIEHRQGNCKEKVKLNAINDFAEQVQEYSHALSTTRCELTKVRASKTSTTHDTTQQILGTELANLNLPNLDNLRRNIHRHRQEQNILPNLPRKEDLSVLPHEYQMTGTGERFLLFDSGEGDINRMFIFATNYGIDMLANSSQWFGDDTFKLCPHIFSQMYTIHVLVNHEVLPCVFALLPSKAEIVYEQFFTTVSNAVRSNNGNDPDGFLVNLKQLRLLLFEMFYRRRIYPIVSSIFHRTCGSISKHIRAELQERYMNVPQFGLQLPMIAALAFVPPRDVVNSFNELCVVIRNQYDGDTDEVLDYFGDTYIGRFRRNAPRRPSLFSIQL